MTHTLALVRVVGRGSVPRLVVVERQTLAAVWTGRVVLTLTDQTLVFTTRRRRLYTVTAVTVTLASKQHSVIQCRYIINDMFKNKLKLYLITKLYNHGGLA